MSEPTRTYVPEYRDEEPVLPLKYTGNILVVIERPGYPPMERVRIRGIESEEAAQKICDRLNGKPEGEVAA